MNNISLYIHWPYCLKKCPYCDFNSHVAESIPQNSFADAYLTEINNFKNLLSNKNITSVYFGGGTPSLMDPIIVKNILDKLKAEYELPSNIEITLEANPTSVESSKFEKFASAGINRVSLGVQSLRKEALAFLGREHSADEAKSALKIAKDNFANYNFDISTCFKLIEFNIITCFF